MQEQLEKIEKMMLTFGQPVLTEPTIPSEDRITLRWKLSYEENKEGADAAMAGDKVKVLDGLADEMVVLLGKAHEYGMGHILQPAFDEVMRSNMTKACKTEEEAVLTCQIRSKELGVATHWEKVGEYYIVYRTEDKKFLKSINFEEPNLLQILVADFAYKKK